MSYNAVPGTTLYYSFNVRPTATAQPQQRQEEYHNDMLKRSDDTLELEERQSGPTVYISINTCKNPVFNNDADKRNPPQLSMIIAETSPGQELGSSVPNALTIPLTEGYAMRAIPATSGSIIIGVAPPNADIDKSSSAFIYSVAASLTAPYHNVFDDSETLLSLKLVDSDPNAGLLITENLLGWSKNQTNATFGSLEHGPPLNVFANNINYTALNGLQNSYCALSELGQVSGNAEANLNNGVEMGVVHAKPNNDQEQQIYLPNLNATSTYLGRLATLNGSAYGTPVVNGGGTLYPLMNFTTKTDPNCAVMFNLSFCADVNYAVPANPAKYSRAELSALYDNSTAALFQNFTWSLQQVACNTTSTAQYSLAVNCDNCTAAYKTWLCAVQIPKCADFSEHYEPSSAYQGAQGSMTYPENELPDGGDVQLGGPNDWSWLMPRNLAQAPLNGSHGPAITNTTQMNWLATNSSRNNDTIAGKIQPGPYLEILPCEDLCYDLVRMCPASLQFGCPRPGSLLMRASYGQRGVAQGSGAYTCNAPGAVYFKNSATTLFVGHAIWISLLVMAVQVSPEF